MRPTKKINLVAKVFSIDYSSNFNDLTERKATEQPH